MDPLSQAAIGAAAGGAVAGRKMPRASIFVGGLAGMAADLDVLIPAGSDPTIGWIWHRGFTHSLAFVPVGAAICFGLFMLFRPLRHAWKATLLACIVGYLVHAPLDALTSYGTQVFWPFSDYRVALDWMPIIDPVWTLAMIVLLMLAAVRRQPRLAIASLAFAVAYFGFGAWQHGRAVDAVTRLAAARGHEVERLRAMPSPGALSLWRGVYVSDGRIHADGIFVPYVGSTRVKPGQSLRLIDAEDIASLASDESARRQFEVFRWFADDFLVPVEGEATGLISDGRYSLDPARFAPLWGMDFSQTPPRRYRPERAIDGGSVLRATFGRDDSYVPLEYFGKGIGMEGSPGAEKVRDPTCPTMPGHGVERTD